MHCSQTKTVQSVLYEAYTKYGFLTAGEIERLRIKHRLRVVQSLEDGLSRNIMRSIVSDGYFKQEELMVLALNSFTLYTLIPFCPVVSYSFIVSYNFHT